LGGFAWACGTPIGVGEDGWELTERSNFSGSLALSQETGSEQTATATEQAWSDAASGEGQRGHRKRDRETGLRCRRCAERCSRQGRKSQLRLLSQNLWVHPSYCLSR